MAETFTPIEDGKEFGPGPILGPGNAHAVPRGIHPGPPPIPQHEPGAKMDSEKPRANLVLGGFSNALLAVSAVGTMGAQKYTDNGWKVVPDGESRYRDALLRHYLEEAAGQAYDPESQLLHIAHTAWNSLAVLELKLKEMALEHRHE